MKLVPIWIIGAYMGAYMNLVPIWVIDAYMGYVIWVVCKSSKAIVPQEKVCLQLDWPTQTLLMLTRYRKVNPNKKYVISVDLYKKIYDLESQNTRLHAEQWDEFLHIL